MTESQRRNDLTFYENLYDNEGPAMTKSMSAIAWLELNESKYANE